MRLPGPPPKAFWVGFVGLLAPLLLLGAIAGPVGEAVAVAGATVGALVRWGSRFSSAGAGLAPLAALVILVAVVPANFPAELLAAVAGLGLLFWLGSDGRTMATVRDRLGVLALPGFAAFLALGVSLVAPGSVPPVGIAVAGALLLIVLVAAAALLGRPGAGPLPSGS